MKAPILVMMLMMSHCFTGRAEETSLGFSPKKQFEAVIQTSDIHEMTLVFRKAPSHKRLGSYFLGSYSPYVKLLWSPTERYVAVQTHCSRHTNELVVFAVTGTSIKQVNLQDYRQNIFGRLGILHGGRGQVDEPLKWLTNDHLLLQAMGSLPDTEDGFRTEGGYRYHVELRITPDYDDFVGWLEKIEKADENETNK